MSNFWGSCQNRRGILRNTLTSRKLHFTQEPRASPPVTIPTSNNLLGVNNHLLNYGQSNKQTNKGCPERGTLYSTNSFNLRQNLIYQHLADGKHTGDVEGTLKQIPLGGLGDCTVAVEVAVPLAVLGIYEVLY